MSGNHVAGDFAQQNALVAFRWPPVERATRFPDCLLSFLALTPFARVEFLQDLRTSPNEHARFIQTALSSIYAYWLGYEDSPLHLATDDPLEADVVAAKVTIEREMLEHWLKPALPPGVRNQCEGATYLRRYIESNPGIYHPFFEYVKNDMPREQFIEFLHFECVRNEVVDDEVAMIVIGMQGQMKNVMVSNLWDECGNGRVVGFHTHWLRQLLTSLDGIEEFRSRRHSSVPWFTSITSNSFNMMATRPGYKFRAYGSFLMTESWVNAHFSRIIAGMRRVGLMSADATVYFDKHITIDPHHTEQILTALTHQQPVLTEREICEVLWGAHTAVVAGTRLYEESLRHFVA